MSGACLICGADVQQPARGRRRRYCSPACRKSAELELRRLETRLQQLERWAGQLRMWGGDLEAKQLGPTERELARLRERQLVLLGHPGPGISPLVEVEQK